VLNAEFAGLYASEGRPSIRPERLLRAALIQILFTIRSERQLMEQMQYNLLFRWFVGSVSTIRCGCRPCSRRTVTVC
jgi:transposase